MLQSYKISLALPLLFTLSLCASLVSATPKAPVNTSHMPLKVEQEFNIQYQKAYPKEGGEAAEYNAFTYMVNPYLKFTSIVDGFNRILSLDERKLFAGQSRFGECQSHTMVFYSLANNFKTFQKQGLSKEELIKSYAEHYSIDYPFSKEDQKDETNAPMQLAIKKSLATS